ncbi:MAG: NAD(+) diphosphatase [Alphaproteobacteria bacterium]
MAPPRDTKTISAMPDVSAPAPHLGVKPTNFFAGSGLDRAGIQRKDAGWVEAQLADPGCRILPMWRDTNLVEMGDDPTLAMLDADAARGLAGDTADFVLLGVDHAGARFVVDISAHEAPLETPELRGRGDFIGLRDIGALLSRSDGALLAHAKGLMYWHSRHRFCGVCGSATISAEAGHVRKCSDAACATLHFPRTDPAVIMLVTHADKCLLGRKNQWNRYQYSALAGFVEPGESLEEAVAREVKEETAIEVSKVHYHSSQPWPFPGNLMLGFTAEAATTEIEIDPNELVDARWFDRTEVADFEEKSGNKLRVARRVSIARHLIRDWLEGSS